METMASTIGKAERLVTLFSNISGVQVRLIDICERSRLAIKSSYHALLRRHTPTHTTQFSNERVSQQFSLAGRSRNGSHLRRTKMYPLGRQITPQAKAMIFIVDSTLTYK